MNHDWEKSSANILQTTLDLVNQKPPFLTNQQLLRILGQRIAHREILADWQGADFSVRFLYVENQEGQKVITVSLKDGQVTEKETTHE